MRPCRYPSVRTIQFLILNLVLRSLVIFQTPTAAERTRTLPPSLSHKDALPISAGQAIARLWVCCGRVATTHDSVTGPEPTHRVIVSGQSLSVHAGPVAEASGARIVLIGNPGKGKWPQ
jgi:hypothetical protein